MYIVREKGEVIDAIKGVAGMLPPSPVPVHERSQAYGGELDVEAVHDLSPRRNWDDFI